jgi:hypothetical protein
MSKRRGAPRLIEREDPLSFVLRNRPAREILEQLQGKPLTISMKIRKSIGIHPESFRRLVSDLGEFNLVSIRELPKQRRVHPPTATPLRLPLGLELTPQGENVLQITGRIRSLVQREARLLPESSAENWLDGTTTAAGTDSRALT